MDGLPGDLIRRIARFYAHYGTDSVAVGACTHSTNPNGTIAGIADVPEEVDRPPIGCNKNVRRSVVVDISIRRASSDQGAIETELLTDIRESSVPFVMEGERRLRI